MFSPLLLIVPARARRASLKKVALATFYGPSEGTGRRPVCATLEHKRHAGRVGRAVEESAPCEDRRAHL
jgi:hypothetical protein